MAGEVHPVVVELRLVVQVVLVGLDLRVRQLRPRPPSSFSASAAACFASASPLPRRSARSPIVLDLLPRVADLEDGRVRLREPVADRLEQVVLGLEVRGRRGHRRVRLHLDRLRERLVRRRSAAPSRCPAPTFGGFFVPSLKTAFGTSVGFRIAHVPDEPVDARLRLERLVLVLLSSSCAACSLRSSRGLRLLVRERAQDRVPVEESRS